MTTFLEENSFVVFTYRLFTDFAWQIWNLRASRRQ